MILFKTRTEQVETEVIIISASKIHIYRNSYEVDVKLVDLTSHKSLDFKKSLSYIRDHGHWSNDGFVGDSFKEKYKNKKYKAVISYSYIKKPFQKEKIINNPYDLILIEEID